MSNAPAAKSQVIEVTRCFGGGYQLDVDGEFVGIFATPKAAQEFAGTWLMFATKAVAS